MQEKKVTNMENNMKFKNVTITTKGDSTRYTEAMIRYLKEVEKEKQK